MDKFEKLEKLDDLLKKKAITADEFETQKKIILAGPTVKTAGKKSQTIYLVLAFFLGSLGIHNFYAGYKKRAGWQLAITLLFIAYMIYIAISMGMDLVANKEMMEQIKGNQKAITNVLVHSRWGQLVFAEMIGKIVPIWVLVDVLTIHKTKKGEEMIPNRTLKIVLAVLLALMLTWSIVSSLLSLI